MLSIGGKTKWAIIVVAIVIWVFPSSLRAATISEGYSTTQTLPRGSLVSVVKDNPQFVEATNPTNSGLMIGVVVAENESLINIEGAVSDVRVALDGEVSILVSDINGGIEPGDKLTFSSINGVAAKAVDSPITVGVAKEEFDPTDSSQVINESTVSLSNDTDQEVKLGKMTIDFNIKNEPAGSEEASKIPAFLQGVGDTIAGKSAAPTKIVISLFVFIAVIVVVGVLLFGAIRSSMISIGRNPLSRSAIHKGLLQVMLIVSGVIILGVASIVIILRS